MGKTKIGILINFQNKVNIKNSIHIGKLYFRVQKFNIDI